MASLVNTNCAGSKSINSSNATSNIDPVNNSSSVTAMPQSQIISNLEKNNQRILFSEDKKNLDKNNKKSDKNLSKELIPTKNGNRKNHIT